ncbi:hypothetical protein CLV63_12675 [Murinocardiopsis flavida]|uniref:CDP-glycerol:poly(Glycerophosphate) glycerophosphotransferase n=2 Tax=Murinocardiopsis flavida TaxID=645275 RepID=A0A2P8CWX2_9ACTN|nr:hypothetical protein CLV63_12675 [Murinocardiopsis flavida]
MLDVLDAFDSDPRVQVFLTWTRSSIFTNGVEPFLAATGYLELGWEHARALTFDLAITTSLGGELHEVQAPILRIPHGMGYNRFLDRGNDKLESTIHNPQSTIHNPQSTIHNPQSTIRKPAFGLSPEWLMHEGRVVPSAIVLSHSEQRDRLARDCPEALPTAVVAGDPCYDRLLASLPQRRRYRRALGVGDHQQLVVASSTWGDNSLFGRHPTIVNRLLSSLPHDEFRVALILHPNVWHAHGPGQINAWTASAQRAGLLLLDPREGWRAALVASDYVIGDCGSTSYYAAAIGRPVVLEDAGTVAIDDTSPIAALVSAAVTLDARQPVLAQLTEAAQRRDRTEKVAAQWVTSLPGGSIGELRRIMYAFMGVPEPGHPPLVSAVPTPQVDPGPPIALWTVTHWEDDRRVRLRRIPAAVADRLASGDRDGVLVVDDSEKDHRLARLADIVCVRAEELGCTVSEWAEEVFAHLPGAQVALCYSHGRSELRTRLGDGFVVRVMSGERGADPALLPVVLAIRLLTGTPRAELAALDPLTLVTDGGRTVSFTIETPA